MRLILQLCLLLIMLLGAGNHAWGKAAAGFATASRGCLPSGLAAGDSGAPPVLSASGEAAAWRHDVTQAVSGPRDAMPTMARPIVLTFQGATFCVCPGAPPPAIASFRTMNPAWVRDGMNLYAYCEGDPVNKYDYLGMEPQMVSNAEPDSIADIARVVNGVAQVKYGDWAHWWGPIIGGKYNTWWQSPSAAESARLFRNDGNGLRLAGYAEYHDSSDAKFWATELPQSMTNAQESLEAFGKVNGAIAGSIVGGFVLYEAGAAGIAYGKIVAGSAIETTKYAMATGSLGLALTRFGQPVMRFGEEVVDIAEAWWTNRPGPGVPWRIPYRLEINRAAFTNFNAGVRAPFRVVPRAADSGEKFYRAMSEKEYARLLKNGGLSRRLSGSSELGITQDINYLQGLSGRSGQAGKYTYLVEFDVQPGTLQKLIDSGATHPSAASLFPDLPAFQRGLLSPQIKLEKGGVLSVLLGGSDEAVGLFNSSVTGFRLVP